MQNFCVDSVHSQLKLVTSFERCVAATLNLTTQRGVSHHMVGIYAS